MGNTAGSRSSGDASPTTADPNPTGGRTSSDVVFNPTVMGLYVLVASNKIYSTFIFRFAPVYFTNFRTRLVPINVSAGKLVHLSIQSTCASYEFYHNFTFIMYFKYRKLVNTLDFLQSSPYFFDKEK